MFSVLAGWLSFISFSLMVEHITFNQPHYECITQPKPNTYMSAIYLDNYAFNLIQLNFIIFPNGQPKYGRCVADKHHKTLNTICCAYHYFYLRCLVFLRFFTYIFVSYRFISFQFVWFLMHTLYSIKYIVHAGTDAGHTLHVTTNDDFSFRFFFFFFWF